MPELIDSGNVIAWLNVQIEKARHGDLPIDAIAYYGDAIMFVKNLPTIEPEVRHGRWIYSGYDEYPTCSYCKQSETYAGDYCGNCGARMDGGADNGTA